MMLCQIKVSTPNIKKESQKIQTKKPQTKVEASRTLQEFTS
jgi:hypothetical protein